MRAVYEQKKREFEEALVRSELKPTPGEWWIEPVIVDPATLAVNGFRSVNGNCCALSPAVLEKQVEPSVETVAPAFDVDKAWVHGALTGFDGYPSWNAVNALYADGYAWGQYMREKYVTS